MIRRVVCRWYLPVKPLWGKSGDRHKYCEVIASLKTIYEKTFDKRKSYKEKSAIDFCDGLLF